MEAANFVPPERTCGLTESNMGKENKQCEQPGDCELAPSKHTSTWRKFYAHALGNWRASATAEASDFNAYFGCTKFTSCT